MVRPQAKSQSRAVAATPGDTRPGEALFLRLVECSLEIGVGVTVAVGVSVAVGVNVGVLVGVGPSVGVNDSVGVNVCVGVCVFVGVNVSVGVGVAVGVSGTPLISRISSGGLVPSRLVYLMAVLDTESMTRSTMPGPVTSAVTSTVVHVLLGIAPELPPGEPRAGAVL